MLLCTGVCARTHGASEGRRAALRQLLLRVPSQAGAQDLPRLHHPQHAGQADPLHRVGQGAALPAPLWQASALHPVLLAGLMRCRNLSSCKHMAVLQHMEHAGQATPLHHVGQGAALPAPVWQASALEPPSGSDASFKVSSLQSLQPALSCCPRHPMHAYALQRGPRCCSMAGQFSVSCTIRSTPDKLTHCIMWAEELLSQYLLGRSAR